MANEQSEPFLGSLHDCYFGTDPRINQDLAETLKDKNIVIAGAGRGIGRACAELFSHGSPRSISLVALEQDEVDDTAALCQSIRSSIKTKSSAFDVTDPVAVQEFLETVHKDFGAVDILVMNAGRPPQWLPLSEGDPKLWWDTVAVSLQGAYNFTRYALPLMQEKKQGRIIFTSSAAAHTNRGISSYIIGKLGMVRLAEIIHAENFQDYNIKAFAIHPGAIATRFYHDFKNKVEGHTEDLRYVSDTAEGEAKSAETAMSFFTETHWDTPYMAAGMTTALASGQLDFMSGRYVDCSLKVEQYTEKQEAIVSGDLHRVRLNAGEGQFIPELSF